MVIRIFIKKYLFFDNRCTKSQTHTHKNTRSRTLEQMDNHTILVPAFYLNLVEFDFNSYSIVSEAKCHEFGFNREDKWLWKAMRTLHYINILNAYF